jgi:Polyketide cyclase / dehydrase and lipid transport
VAELPSAGDRHHRVNSGIGGLQIAVRPIEADAAQILQRRGAEMAAKDVLNRAGRDAYRRGDVAEPDVPVGVFVDERDCPAQRPGLRGRRFGSGPHEPVDIPNDHDPKPPQAHRRPDTICLMTERIEVQRTIAAPAADIFAILCDPQGHVAIDATGMLQSADGDPAQAVGDSFVVHMDREALNDYPLGKYDVTVEIRDYDKDRLIGWTILGQLRPQIGHIYGYRLEPADGGTLVTSFYDWSDIDPHWREANIFPVISEGALRATLGILDRTVHRGYPRG